MDLLFVGVACSMEAISQYWFFGSKMYLTQLRAYEDTILYCVWSFGFSLMNEISTPLTMLALAIQRYFKVCRPFVANRRVFSKYQLWGNIIITAIPVLLIIPHAVVVFYRYNPVLNFRQICYAGFFVEPLYRASLGGTLFFYLPVTICGVLYIFVGRSLLNMTTMEARNRQLTIIFMFSCLLWFLFWLPERIMYHYYETIETVYGRSKTFHFFMNKRDFITKLFSLIQPVIIVLSYRPLQEPIANLCKKLNEKCRCSANNSND